MPREDLQEQVKAIQQRLDGKQLVEEGLRDYVAVQRAIDALLLFRDFYASSKPFHDQAREVIRVLWQGGKNYADGRPQKVERNLRCNVAEALAQTYFGRTAQEVMAGDG